MLRAVAFSPKSFLQSCHQHYDEQEKREVDHAGRTRRRCERKVQLTAVRKHLEQLGCQTIVIEDPYVDQDFLEDFSAYYVRAFPKYERFCRRLHFFTGALDPGTFSKFLEAETQAFDGLLQSAYLGFLVLRPLPGAFLGRTCIKPLPDDARREHEPFLREYSVHLAGVDLAVATLGFQEQDRIVAACATSAVWSALHKAGQVFGIRVPSPSEITQLAMRDSHRRGLPTDGLSVFEIGQAIRRAGLEIEIRENIEDLKAFVYGYGCFGLPCILGVALYVKDPQNPAKLIHVGPHAITVTGFDMNDQATPSQLFSDRIAGLYAHDDQAGPFRYTKILQKIRMMYRAEPSENWHVETEFPDSRGKVYGMVLAAIVPVDPMIRIRFEEAIRMQIELRDILAPILVASSMDPFEWDVRLASVNELRSKIGRAAGMTAGARKHILESNWAKYVWRVTARHRGGEALEMIIDCTDIRRAFYVREIVVRDPALRTAIKGMLADNQTRGAIEQDGEWGTEWARVLDEATQ